MILRVYKVCDTPWLRAEGLQNETIEDDECCLFFGCSIDPVFWGKNTLEDIYASIAVDGIIADSKVIRAFDMSPVRLVGDGDFVIESKVELPIGSTVSIEDGLVLVDE